MGSSIMIKTYAISYTIFLFVIGCGTNSLDEIDYGQLQDGVYTNNYFEMSIDIPSDWAIQNRDAMQEITKLGEDMVTGDDKSLKAIMKASSQQTVTMFMVYRHETGTPVPYNQSISCVAERILHMPGIKRGSDYLFHAKKLMNSGQVEFKFPKEIYSEVISGIEFDIMPTEIIVGEMTIQQKYYASKLKDYVLAFILSFTTEEEEKSLMEIMHTLKFSASD